MRTVVSDEAFAPFDPKSVEAMGQAFQAAWNLVVTSGVNHEGDADKVREQIALHIIKMAQAGERNATRLRDGAVAWVMRSDDRKQA